MQPMLIRLYMEEPMKYHVIDNATWIRFMEAKQRKGAVWGKEGVPKVMGAATLPCTRRPRWSWWRWIW